MSQNVPVEVSGLPDEGNPLPSLWALQINFTIRPAWKAHLPPAILLAQFKHAFLPVWDISRMWVLTSLCLPGTVWTRPVRVKTQIAERVLENRSSSLRLILGFSHSGVSFEP